MAHCRVDLCDSQLSCRLETDALVTSVFPLTSTLVTDMAYIRANDSSVKPDLTLASSLETNAAYIRKNETL